MKKTTVKKFYNEFAVDYDKNRYKTKKQKDIDQAARSAYVELSGDVKGLKHLDVGCGTGRIIETFCSRGAKCTGMDSSPNMLKAAKEKNPTAKFKEGSIFKIPFPAGQYDIVTCSQVLTHLAEYKKLITEMVRVAKPGGNLIFDVRNRFYWKNFLYQFKLMLTPTAEYAPHFTSECYIKKVCKELGLEVEKVYGHYDKVHKKCRKFSATLVFKVKVPDE